MFLPLRALYEIRAFSKPMTRPDWRTCKKEESDLLWDIVCGVDAQDRLDTWEVLPEWTLYGKLWYLKKGVDLMARMKPLSPPPPFEVYDREYERIEFPCQLEQYRTDFFRIDLWYQYRAQWIHG